MGNPFSKRLTLFFLATWLILLSGPAIAKDGPLSCTEAAALVQQFLPQGVTLANAGDAQLDEAIFNAVTAQPADVVEIVTCSCETRPAKATVITAAAIRALPDKEKEIIAAARRALRGKGENVERDFSLIYGEWSPLTDRQERPSSPVKP